VLPSELVLATMPVDVAQSNPMAKLSVKEIQAEALRIIAAHAGGIRYSDLVTKILEVSPETPRNTISGSVWNLETIRPDSVRKPSRGLYQPASAAGLPTEEPKASKVKEDAFYESFGEWLKNELDEVTDVVALGGASFRTKWGTPDVLGVYKPLASNLIKFQIEIVSAEVKVNPLEAITAFGQAVAYRLFSAKTYIAMTATIAEDDLSRLESLCMLFGVGLVVFDLSPKAPNYRIRMRAQRFSADMFYVNELADRLKSQDPQVFEKLFR
jgi:hypothetical protein